MLQYVVWNVNPNVVSFGGFEVRWYGLLWALGFMLGYVMEERKFKHEGLPENWVDKLFIYMFVGVVIGARLGHCIFYDWAYYSKHLSEILAVWNGGLSSHGGAIGIVTALWLYNKRVCKQEFHWIFDRVVGAIALTGACIRFGNLMNSEIYGHPTTMPWGFIFERGHENVGLPCHPTQIYEMLYCLVTLAVCEWLYWKRQAYKRVGLIFGVFLIGIFLTRILLEFIKNDQSDFERDMWLNMGQILSIPFVIWGGWLIVRAMKRPPVETSVKA